MRSDTNEEKLAGAMRIFEALSEVDEELLVKCKEEHQRVIPFWKYGKALVACVCVLLLGGLMWRAPQLTKDAATSGSAAYERGDAEVGQLMEEAFTSENIEDAAKPESEIEDMIDILESDNGFRDTDGLQGMEGTTETVTNKSESVKEEDGEDEVIADTATGCPQNMSAELSESQAREVVILGSYIPEALPAGYVFESASATKKEETAEYEELLVVWTKGMDDIWWSVQKVEASEITCVDVNAFEKYDEHLYDIPYAETVPEEYREVFLDPVFRVEDLSLEVIGKRMKTVQDVGDTDTPRGNFSVLYQEGILVQFNGDGTAQEVWAMFQSLQK